MDKCPVCGMSNGQHDLERHRKSRNQEVEKAKLRHPAFRYLRRKKDDNDDGRNR